MHAVEWHSFKLLQNTIQNYLSSSYDSVGILLIQCIIDKYRQIMNERTEYGLNVYFDVVSQMLLQVIVFSISIHCFEFVILKNNCLICCPFFEWLKAIQICVSNECWKFEECQCKNFGSNWYSSSLCTHMHTHNYYFVETEFVYDILGYSTLCWIPHFSSLSYAWT